MTQIGARRWFNLYVRTVLACSSKNLEITTVVLGDWSGVSSSYVAFKRFLFSISWYESSVILLVYNPTKGKNSPYYAANTKERRKLRQTFPPSEQQFMNTPTYSFNSNKTTREATFHPHKPKLLPGIYRVSISLCSAILLTVIVTGWFIDTWLQMRLYRRSTAPVVRSVVQWYEETDEPSATYSGLVQPFNVLTTLGAGYSCSLLIRLGIIGISAHPFALCSLPFIRSQSIGE